MKFLNWLINTLFPGYLSEHQPPKPEGAAPIAVSAPALAPGITPAPSPTVPVLEATVRGLDVSHYEPEVDYAKAFSQGFRWVYAKATDGDSSDDARMIYHRMASKNAGLAFGAFCFNRFDADPVKQASHFMLITGGVKSGELPPCLDVEWDRYAKNTAYHDGGKIDDKGSEHCLITLRELEKLSGMVPVWYTHHWFFQGVTPSLVKEFARYPLWLTQPNVKAPTPIPGLPKITFFQNTFHQPGLASQNPDGIDADIFYGDLAALKALCR